jgi:hypothetical protein
VQLGIIFGERLQLALLPPFYIASFRADGVQYGANNSNGLSFLYDRLLDVDGQLAGVLLWCFPHDGVDAALTALGPGPRPYLVRDPDSSSSVARYEVHFRDLAPAQADELTSDGAQSFGDQVFQSPGGGVALTVNLADLLDAEPAEQKALAMTLAPAAHWPVITDVAEFPVAEA